MQAVASATTVRSLLPPLITATSAAPSFGVGNAPIVKQRAWG
jgi:hypothetical protein